MKPSGGIYVATEQRIRVSSDRVRVPDLVVVRQGPQPEVLTLPPLLVVEILSPLDSYSDTQRRAEDYRRMGVETVWVIDPETRSGRMCVGERWIGAERMEVPETAIYVHLAEIFEGIGDLL